MFNIVVILPRWIESPGGEFWQAFISSFIRCYHITILALSNLSHTNDGSLCFFSEFRRQIWVSMMEFWTLLWILYIYMGGSCIRTSDRADILLIAELSAKAFSLWPLFTVDGSLPLGWFSWKNFFLFWLNFWVAVISVYTYSIFLVTWQVLEKTTTEWPEKIWLLVKN